MGHLTIIRRRLIALKRHSTEIMCNLITGRQLTGLGNQKMPPNNQ
nr:hypothetical protein Iba_chr15aCG2470 [Ipomoea batatas]